MRILVADDDTQIVEYFSDVLAGEGFSVSAATTGAQALKLLRDQTFDVALLDWVMPEPNGLDLCEAIRTKIGGGYTYTIVISGKSDKEDMISGLRAGADDYLCKPVSPQELLLRINVGRRILSLGSRHVAVFMMAKLAESRDIHTGQHLERIRHYSWLLARRLAPEFPEITQEFIGDIFHTSPLHDIGKVGIPDQILLKPGRLTTEEFEIMKTHTTLGAETLSTAVRHYPETPYFVMARDIALAHHENFDGSGYPRGLQGNDIPLSGRIVALADVYDALRSERPYKQAFDHRAAKGIILQRQEHFDPMVLSVFFELEEEFQAVKNTVFQPEQSLFPLPSGGGQLFGSSG